MILYKISECKIITVSSSELVFKPTWIGRIFGVGNFSEQYINIDGNWRNICDGTLANPAELEYLNLKT